MEYTRRPLLILIITVILGTLANLDNFRANLQNSYSIANMTLNHLKEEWQVDDYPNFLKSCTAPRF